MNLCRSIHYVKKVFNNWWRIIHNPCFHMFQSMSMQTRDSDLIISYFWISQFPPLGINFMEIGLSLLPGPHSGRHFLRTSGCVPPWQHLKPILKHILLRKLTRYDCVPYWYILLQICFYYLHRFLTFITSLYQLCQSLVIIECYILMLYHNCITIIYLLPCMFYVNFMYSAGKHCGSALHKSINYY